MIQQIIEKAGDLVGQFLVCAIDFILPEFFRKIISQLPAVCFVLTHLPDYFFRLGAAVGKPRKSEPKQHDQQHDQARNHKELDNKSG